MISERHFFMSTPTKKKKRDHVDPVFKEVVERRFTELGLPLETEVEVGRLPRKIDIIGKKMRKNKKSPKVKPHLSTV